MRTNKIFNGYWMGYQPDGNTLGETPSYVNKVTLFVAGAAPDGKSVGLSFLTKAYPQEEQIAWARQLQAQGTEVLMSIMDSSTIYWSEVDIPAYVQNFKDVVIDGPWGLSGVVIDLESKMPSSVWADKFTELIQEFRKVLGPKGTTNSSGQNISRVSVVAYQPSNEKPILEAIGSQLDWLDTMAYGNGAQGNEELFNWYSSYVSQVNLGIGVDYQQGQSTNLEQVKLTAKFAAQTENCGMMEFGLNNDEPGYSEQPQWAWASAINTKMNG